MTWDAPVVVTALVRNPHGRQEPHRITGIDHGRFRDVWTVGGQRIHIRALLTDPARAEETPQP